MHGNLVTMQTFLQEEIPLGHSAADFGKSAREIRHSATFGEYFIIRRSVSDLGNVRTSSKRKFGLLFVGLIHISDNNILPRLTRYLPTS